MLSKRKGKRIIAMYEGGEYTKHIMRELGVSAKAMYETLKEANVKLRSEKAKSKV